MFSKIFIFSGNDFISSNQSSFKLGDYYVNDGVPIKNEIYKSFDKGHEIRGVFLNFSKTFDSVWHDFTIFKVTQTGISRNFLARLLMRENNSYFLMIRDPHGQMSQQEYLKIPLLVYYCF